jgi:hypothetical protein
MRIFRVGEGKSKIDGYQRIRENIGIVRDYFNGRGDFIPICGQDPVVWKIAGGYLY